MIVVGIDGSAGADLALTEAIAEAQLRKQRLRIVCAWEIPPTVYGGGFAANLAAVRNEVRKTAEQITAEAVKKAEDTAPEITCEGGAVEGQGAEVLLKEAENASLAVVGNRGHGGFASLLLGSVSQQVVHHAHCPVLVVRDRRS